MRYAVLAFFVGLGLATVVTAHESSRGASPPAGRATNGPPPASPGTSTAARSRVEKAGTAGVGVVRSIEPQTERITISYEAIAPLNWPAGVMPFGVAKTALLDGITVGMKVRFRIESQQIIELTPF
jgi:Cu/Ag efflux protein CusF